MAHTQISYALLDLEMTEFGLSGFYYNKRTDSEGIIWSITTLCIILHHPITSNQALLLVARLSVCISKTSDAMHNFFKSRLDTCLFRCSGSAVMSLCIRKPYTY